MASNTLILETPPQLNQKQIYSGDEAEMACWATSAEMIAKWKRPNTFFVRPKFSDKLPKNESDIRLRSIIENTKSNKAILTPEEAENQSFLSRVNYKDFVSDWLFAWGFRKENVPQKTSWSAEQITELLQNKGPLYCYGQFFPGGSSTQIGGQAHAIAVYGYSENSGGFHFIDPWDGLQKKMNLRDFNQKIEKINQDAICSRVPNWKDPKLDIRIQQQ